MAIFNGCLFMGGVSESESSSWAIKALALLRGVSSFLLVGDGKGDEDPFERAGGGLCERDMVEVEESPKQCE